MADDERCAALDVCPTPPHTPTAADGKAENDDGTSGGGAKHGSGGDDVEYALKPKTRAYASTARYTLHALHAIYEKYSSISFSFLFGQEEKRVAKTGSMHADSTCNTTCGKNKPASSCIRTSDSTRAGRISRSRMWGLGLGTWISYLHHPFVYSFIHSPPPPSRPQSHDDSRMVTTPFPSIHAHTHTHTSAIFT